MALILDGTTGVPVGTVTGTLPVANGGSGVTTSTGSGANVLGTSPTLTTPTFDSASLVTISGTAPLYMCRAWVNFNGQGTVAIRASGNVSSITDNGTGDYTVNFTTAMVDINYAAVGSSGFTSSAVEAGYVGFNRVGAGGAESAPTTTAVRVNSLAQTGSVSDQKYVNVAIFR